MKKMLALMLLALCLLPAMAGAELIVNGVTYPDNYGEIPINNGETISGSATGVYLVAGAGVNNLTFENVNITAPDGFHHGLELKAEQDVTLTFKGDNNVLTGGNTSDTETWGGDGIYKKFSSGRLIIYGNVTANGGRTTDPSYDGTNGIYAPGGVTIHGNVTANGSDGESGGDGIFTPQGSVIVEGTLTAKAGMSTLPVTHDDYGDKCGSGIYAFEGDVTINGSLTIIQSGSGIYKEYGTVTIGGKVDITSVKGAIRAMNLEINDGVELMGRTDKNADWTPIQSMQSNGIFYTKPIAHTKPLPVDNTGAGAVGSAAEVQPGDLPQTGDASMLGMWACLLAAGGAAMKARRKRA